MNVPGSNQQFSRAEVFIKEMGWPYKDNGDQLIVAVCPFKKCDNYHFYVAKGGNKDGLFDCKKCGEVGNLDKLMASQGRRPMRDILSMQQGVKEKEPLPNIEACHAALLADDDALAYLDEVRGYSIDIIKRQKLGLCMRAFKKTGWKDVKTLVIPHIMQGNVVWVKYRTLPPAPKDFDSPRGWDATLYNEDAIVKDMPELLLVEGEGDALALMSNGVEYVCGVPGANFKRADWIMKLDELKVQKIYILYDSDKTGQEAAQELAQRIGTDRCFKITIPPFKITDSEGNEKDGKDINEWFAAGHSLEEFELLKEGAKQFDVVGVMTTVAALDDLEEQILTGGSKPKYLTPWKPLDCKLGGFNPGDVIDIIAEGKHGKTTLVMNILEFLVRVYNETAFLYCLEMPQTRMARKWVSHVTQTDDSPESSQMTVDVVRAAKNFALNRDAELLFGYTSVRDVDEVYSVIRQTVRRYGAKFVALDNLQLLADKTLRNESARTVHLSRISKNLKDLAMELGLVMFRIIQPNKVREGDVVSSRNADGSSQIEKDCDAMIALTRNRRAQLKKEDLRGVIDEVNAFEPQIYVRVDLSRYAPGGTTTLWFDGARSTVREFDQSEVQATPTPQTGWVLPESERVEA